MTQAVDHLALLPLYAAAGTALLVLIVELAVGRFHVPVGLVGAAATIACAVSAPSKAATFCDGDLCSWVLTQRAGLAAVLFALLTAGVLALSAPSLRRGDAPAGEFVFLLACSMTGGITVAYAGDLVTLVVGLETLTLPLYILVGLRRPTSSPAAVTFFLISVVSTAVALLGAALLYVATGELHLSALTLPTGQFAHLGTVGAGLLVVGLGFKVAAVPLHAWAPTTYDGAPVPVAAYLSTASKLGGVLALVAVVPQLATVVAGPGFAEPGGAVPVGAVPVGAGAGLAGAGDAGAGLAGPGLTGPVVAVVAALAVLTMTVGNLVALRQTRTVRLLAFSSVAQAGYILAPLVAGAAGVTASFSYAVFFVLLEFVAFAVIVAVRGSSDGGSLDDLRGAGRRNPWLGAAFVLAFAGLAGLPPGLAGLFAKVAVVRSLVATGWGWLAVVVVLNAVVALAYYLRVVASFYAPDVSGRVRVRAPGWVAACVGAFAILSVLIGFLPQVVFDLL